MSLFAYFKFQLMFKCCVGIEDFRFYRKELNQGFIMPVWELCFVLRDSFSLANSGHVDVKTVILVAIHVKIEMVSSKCLYVYFTFSTNKAGRVSSPNSASCRNVIYSRADSRSSLGDWWSGASVSRANGATVAHGSSEGISHWTTSAVSYSLLGNVSFWGHD